MKDWIRLFTPNINAILDGGKKSILPQTPVQFGIPSSNQLPKPVLPRTANSTEQTRVQPAPIAPAPNQSMVPAPKPTPAQIRQRGGTITAPKVNPLLNTSFADARKLGQAKEWMLAQQQSRNEASRAKLRERLGSLAPLLVGTGKPELPTKQKGAIGVLESMGSVAREKGIPGLLTEGFGNLLNPTQEDANRRIFEFRDKLIEAGTDPALAMDKAIKNLANQNPNAPILSKFNVPTEDLTPEEKSALRLTNFTEKLFAGLDAPIFLGTTKPVKMGLKTLLKPAKYTPEMTEVVTKFAEVANGVSKATPAEKIEIKELAQELADAMVAKGIITKEASTSGDKTLANTLKQHMDESLAITQDAQRPAKQAEASRARGGVSDIKQLVQTTPASEAIAKGLTEDEFVKGQGNPEEWVVRKPIKLPEEVFRGTSKNTGSGFAMFGQGRYTSTSLSEAKKYGDVSIYGKESIPSNPLQFEKTSDFSQWEYAVAKQFGLRRNTLYPKNSGPDNLVKAMGYDGITIGKGKSMMLVKFNADKSTMSAPKTTSQLRAEYQAAKVKQPTATAQPEAVPTPRLDNQSVSSANLTTEANQPVNQKLADFKAGKGSMEGGYVANPFQGKPKENIFTPKLIAPTEIPNYKRLTNDKVFTRLREVVQDSWVRAKKLQQQKGVVTKEGANPYLAETLYHGRVHTRLEETRDVIKNIDLDIVASSKKLQVPNSTFSKDVNEFLQSQHAPERNAKLGDGAAGMTTAEAEANLARIKNSPQGKEVVRIANQLSDLNKRVVEVLKDSQVISDETYKTLTDTYKNHVPLNRVMDETEDISQALTGAGFNVRGTGIQRAKGSSREVSDIITNITSNVQQAIIRAEKNLVDLNTLNFARNNKDLGLFEVIKPKAMGTDFSGKPIIEKITDPSVLALRENGKPIYVKVNDPKLAVMYQNVNAEQMPSWLQFIGTITRTYAGLHTRFNYEFAFGNKLRDIQEMAVDMASRKEMGFKQAGKSITKEPESVLAVTDFLRGKDTAGLKLYQQMKLDGGTTGGLSLSTRADIEIDIESIRKLNRSKPRQAAEKVIRAVDAWNTIFEDSTRLSVYKTALKNGSSRTEAAMLAKESTVNFNKKGTGGTVINSFYMFANASIQGTTKMLRAMKNPKVAATVVSGVSLGVYSVNEHNTKVDPNWRDKVSSFDRTSNLVILLPTADGKEANFIKLPISYGLKPIKVAAENAYDFMSGYNTSVADAAAGIAVAVATSYNPLAGDESIVRTLTPTIGKTAIEIQANRAWHGGRIRPDFNDNLPDSAQYFDSLSRTQTGKMAISATESLSEKGIMEVSPANVIYSYNAIIGGAGRSISKLFNTGAAVVTGETLEPREVPIASRFFGKLSSEQSETGEIYKVKEEQDTLKADRQVKTERLYQEIKDLPKAQIKARLQELAVSDPEMLDKVIDKLSAPELTKTEKAIKSLDNKARATYIDKKLRAMPKGERKAYMANLIEKGVISDATLEELESLTIEN